MKKTILISMLALVCSMASSQTSGRIEDMLPDAGVFAVDETMLLECYPQAGIKPIQRPNIQREAFSHSLQFHFTPNNTSTPDFLIIIPQSLYNSLVSEIRRYAEDVHAVYGYGIYVETTVNDTPEDLRSLIQSYQNNLHGVIFIGDLSECIFEIDVDYHNPDYGYRNWPCDLYFMDLDGTWTDSDNNGIYDQHTGNTSPEIFFGRLSAEGMLSMGSETLLIRSQLQKSHDFWWKSSYNAADTVLNHIGIDWINNFLPEYISPAIPSGLVDDIRYNNPVYSKADYLDRLTHDGYAFTHLAAHSNPLRHRLCDSSQCVNVNHIVFVNDIKQHHSYNGAYNLFCCSACNWLGASADGYLGGAYLFDGLKTMAVVGSTKTGGMLRQGMFYSQFATKNIGEAFTYWFGHHGFGNYYEGQWEFISWSYGMTILGDPTIKLWHSVSDLCQQNLSLTSYPSANQSNLVMFKAGQRITVSSSFTIPQGVHVIFDAPEVVFENGFLCPAGATFETRNEGCEL